MKKKLRLIVICLLLGICFLSCEKNDSGSGGTTVVRYHLTVLPNNAEWGIAVGGGYYNNGDRVDIEAVPASDCYFIRWSDGSISNPRTITVSSDITLYAIFDVNQINPDSINPGPNNPINPTITEWVDLGLPSGTIWCSHNVGANSPEASGNYYAWGEVNPKNIYSWSTYRYGNYLNQLTKYCNNSQYGLSGFTDNLTVLEAEDDAATENMGNGARTPSVEEWKELLTKTIRRYTSYNGVMGFLFIANNGNSIFLPSVGCFENQNLIEENCCYYWTNALRLSSPYNAVLFCTNSRGEYDFSINIPVLTRYHGCTVRAVRSSK